MMTTAKAVSGVMANLLIQTFEALLRTQIHLLRLCNFLDDFLNDESVVVSCFAGRYFDMIVALDNVDLHFPL